jgi:hypothetical protein
MTDLFEQRLRTAARKLPVPGAPPDLIDRVIAERALGQRVELPTTTTSRRRRWVPGILAAAVFIVAIMLAGTALLTTRAITHVASVDSLSSTGSFFVSNAWAAQTVKGPGFPPLPMTSGASIRPGTYQYRIQYVDSAGLATPDRTGTVRISDSPESGAEAWRVEHVAESAVPGQQRIEAETLLVAKRDLRPMTRVVSVKPYLRFSGIHIVQRFTNDSVLGEMSTDGGVRRPIARQLPTTYAPYLTDALAPFSLVGVPLSRDWKASLSIIGWAVVPSDVFFPVSLRVIGEETIDTPAGSIDCWKLAVDAGQEHRVEWVRKSDGLGIRSYDERSTPRGHRVYNLLTP